MQIMESFTVGVRLFRDGTTPASSRATYATLSAESGVFTLSKKVSGHEFRMDTKEDAAYVQKKLDELRQCVEGSRVHCDIAQGITFNGQKVPHILRLTFNGEKAPAETTLTALAAMLSGI